MVYFEKSQPAPECLGVERAKAYGDYKCANVLDRIKTDFKNKCYICEYKEPIAINVEHFMPHKGDLDLKFDWNNLFWSCSHCNSVKSDDYQNILNCTKHSDEVENKLKYAFKPFPYEMVRITELDNSDRTSMTKQLLTAVYNGTTKLKTIEASNLRNILLKEIMEFQRLLCEYFHDTNSDDDREYYLIKIRGHIHRGSNFTSFKRWIILENDRLNEEFGRYFD